jgi:hypothetical protein
MSDITKCHGFECPMKESCKRFTAKPNEFAQSYFLDPPYKINDDGFSCDMYWGATAEAVWGTLQDAVGVRIPNFKNTSKDIDS